MKLFPSKQISVRFYIFFLFCLPEWNDVKKLFAIVILYILFSILFNILHKLFENKNKLQLNR